MKIAHPFISVLLAGLSLALPAAAKLTPEQIATLPPAATHPVDFKTEIKPIFEASCIRCHGRGRDKGGLQLDSRETLLKGGDSGAAIVPGHGDQSDLIELVAGLDPDTIMPKKGKKLSPEQIGVLRAWIDQGAIWDPSVGFGPVAALNLTPHEPRIPDGDREENPVDRFIDAYFTRQHLAQPAPVPDNIYIRRVSLDTIGLLPTPDEVKTFEADHSANKREKLVGNLLSRSEAYAENWMSFWNDLLRNDYKGTGYIDGGRKQITKWLYHSLATNKPYDQFVAELINPNDESAGFSKGIVWRGVVNASQKPQMQAAQNISQVFLGINLKCASCHDSFINDWQLSDAYGLANIYADSQQEIFECDKPTGKMASTKFLFPQLGTVHSSTNKQVRLKELADVMTCPKDGRLTRTVINRLWAKFLGRGLVEPVDDMQQTAWDQDLLDWLSEDLVAHHYDIKATIARILTSKAYQMPATDPGETRKENYTFAGPEVRRMTAEEFRDALTALTGVGYTSADADIGVSDARKRQFGAKKTAYWIWNDPHAAQKAKAGSIYLRKTVTLQELPHEATAMVACDNSFELFVNGQKAGSGADYSKPTMVDMKPWLKKGENLIAIHAINNLPDNTAPRPGQIAPAGTENPAGLFLYARVRLTGKAETNIQDFASDKTWIATDAPNEGWQNPAYATNGWQAADELGVGNIVPWRLSGGIVASEFAELYRKTHFGNYRAVLVAADPLTTALGRPNREQVVTTRPTTATTLQALELTNGKTLAEIIRRGAVQLARDQQNGRALVTNLYEKAMARKPTREEEKLAGALVGKKSDAAGVEDFLWAMAMLPEFQLIY